MIDGYIMFEDLAARYYLFDGIPRAIVLLAPFILGAAFSGLRRERQFELSRVPFLAAYTYVLVLLETPHLFWLALFPAMESNLVWAVATADVVICFVAGFILGAIGAARSRNRLGHAKAAILAFIPIAFFYLFLAPARKNAPRENLRFTQSIRGAQGIVVSVSHLFVAAVLHTHGGRLIELDAAYDFDSTHKAVLHAEYLIRAKDLTPVVGRAVVDLDDGQAQRSGRLKHVRADGTTIVFTYQVPLEKGELTAERERRIKGRDICDNAMLFRLIRKGALVRDVYEFADGRTASIQVDRQTCDRLRPQ